MIGVILFALFFVFLFMGLPVGFALGVSSLAAIGHAGYPITVLAQRMFTAVDSLGQNRNRITGGSFNEPRRYHEAYH